MAVTGLLMVVYLLFEAKKPNDSGNVWMPKWLDKHFLNNPYVLKLLGEETKYYSIHQMGNLLRSNIWPAFSQFSLAMSRLCDVEPEAILAANLEKFSNK